MLRQRTLRESIKSTGVGLHSGNKVGMMLCPAPADTGIVFRRTDLSPVRDIPARADWVDETDLSTSLGSGEARVTTVEHLLSALCGLGIDNAYIDMDSAEVPIMDGSAKTFVERIQAEGLIPQRQERRALVITNPVWTHERDKYAGFMPCPRPWFDVTIDFKSRIIGKQNYSMPLTEALFSSQIAAARTFGFEDQLPGP